MNRAVIFNLLFKGMNLTVKDAPVNVTFYLIKVKKWGKVKKVKKRPPYEGGQTILLLG